MKKVLLLLADGFEILEASAFIDIMGWNLLDGNCLTTLYTCGLKKEVNSSFNQRLVVDYVIEDIDVDTFDALAIPGGFEEYGFYKEAYDEKVLALVRHFHQKNKIIATICVASLILGKSGIMHNRRGTTYNKNTIRQEALSNSGATLVNEPIVVDDNLITSWNPSTAVDVALKLLEMLTTPQDAEYIREIMGFNDIRITH